MLGLHEIMINSLDANGLLTCKFCLGKIDPNKEECQIKKVMNKNTIEFAHPYDCLFIPVRKVAYGQVFKLRNTSKHLPV